MIMDALEDRMRVDDDVRHGKFLLTKDVEYIKLFLSDVERIFGIEVEDFDSGLYVVIRELKDRRDRDPTNTSMISSYIDRAIELGWNLYCHCILEKRLSLDPYKYISSLS